MFGIRPYKRDVVFFDHLGEAGIFRKKANAGVNGIGVRHGRCGEDSRNVQVTGMGGRRPNADALIGETHMHRIGIGFRVDGDRMDAHFTTRSVNTQSRLSSVGNENLLEHGIDSRCHNNELFAVFDGRAVRYKN